MTIGELGFDFEYILDEDRQEYRNFCLHHCARMAVRRSMKCGTILPQRV